MDSAMKHSVPHDLGQAQARKVAEAAWASYSQSFAEYGPECTWQSQDRANISFRAKGVSLQGFLEVGEREIGLELDVPFFLRPFKSMAMKVIEDEIRRWVEKSKRGEL
jgi:hypothetical protein